MATAPPAQRWLLIEQPGPWGREALLESRFDAAVAPLLAARARAEHVRLLMVRRPGGRLADSAHRWAYADARPGREGLWWSTRTADADLLTAPWDGSAGEPASGPTYLVCAHGGHDACCALRGRPLARALPAAGPADVWECSHLGGDRFAANVLVLPARLLLRAGARRRRGAGRRARAGPGGAAVAARPGRRATPRDRPPSSTPARSWGCSGSTTCRSPTSGRSPGPAPRSSAGRSRWPGPHGDVVATVESRPSSRRREPHLPGDASRTLADVARAGALGRTAAPPAEPARQPEVDGCLASTYG